jgi:Tfp pilus assembly protein PilF
LGNLYLKQGQVSQAIVQFSEALRLDPSYKDAEENLSIAKASDAQFFPGTRK